MKIAVSEFIVKFLEKLNIDTIFGIPGAHVLPIYDHLYDSKIQTILSKHEQGAAFMAGGYNRVSGKIGACVATAGPGATNLITGIANAYADSQPVIAITGEAPTYIFGKGGLQESSGAGGAINQTMLFQGIVGYHKLVERTDYLVSVLKHAVRILCSDKPKPVVISIPYNIQQELIEEELLNEISTTVSLNISYQANLNTELEQAAQLIDDAKAPVIIAGYGCILAEMHSQINLFSSKYNIPVITTLKAKGVVDELSPLAIGSLGVTSDDVAYQYITEHADLLIFLGASFNERTSYVWQDKLTKNKKIIQVDIDSYQLDKVFYANISVQADIKLFVSDLLTTCNNLSVSAKTAVKQLVANKSIDSKIFNYKFDLVKFLFNYLQEYNQSKLTIFDDNIVFAQNFLAIKPPNCYHPNSGISSLGHAIPAAIGAALDTDQERRALFAILGDGGFQMCCMEIMTAVNYKLDINILLFNNRAMGLIRKNQHQHYQQRFIGCDFINPDFELFAQSCDIEYHKITENSDCDTLFEQTDFTTGIRLIEVMLDRDAYPNYSSNR